jgi:hypothetical protein
MYPERETKIADAVGVFALVFFMLVVLFIGWMASLDSAEQVVRVAQQRKTIQRAIEEELVWYDKKGNLVYSGNLRFVLTGEKE